MERGGGQTKGRGAKRFERRRRVMKKRAGGQMGKRKKEKELKMLDYSRTGNVSREERKGTRRR